MPLPAVVAAVARPYIHSPPWMNPRMGGDARRIR